MKFLVLSDHSVLMDGILARMNAADGGAIVAVGSRDDALLEQVQRHEPDVVIMEKTGLNNPSHCSLNLLFERYPNLILVEVNEATGELQLIGSQKMHPKGYTELISYLNKFRVEEKNQIEEVSEHQ